MLITRQVRVLVDLEITLEVPVENEDDLTPEDETAIEVLAASNVEHLTGQAKDGDFCASEHVAATVTGLKVLHWEMPSDDD